MLNSTIAAIASIDGVKRYKVYDNDTNITDSNGIPGHSIAAVVEGGLDADIAKQIYLRKGPGSGTYGDSGAAYVNDDGLSNIIKFSRPVYVSIDASVSLIPGTSYTSAIADTIVSNITGYLNGLDIGCDVTITGIMAMVIKAISNASVPEFSLSSVKISETDGTLANSDIAIGYKEIAQAGTITVTEVS